MRCLAVLALFVLPLHAFAGAWGVDVGLVGGIGLSHLSALPSGVVAPPGSLFSLFGPDVQSSGGLGLAGQAGFEVALHHKRRFMASLQCSWQGQNITLDQSIGAPFDLANKTVWEWSGLLLPLELSYAFPLAARPGFVLMGRAGAGAWYQKSQSGSKQLSSGATNHLSQAWNGPPDDWGPLLGLGLDWVALPSGKRVCSFEVRATQGQALLDPIAGAGQAVWTLGAVLSVPVTMWVL